MDIYKIPLITEGFPGPYVAEAGFLYCTFSKNKKMSCDLSCKKLISHINDIVRKHPI